MPFRLTVFGNVIVWFGPALTIGAAFAGSWAVANLIGLGPTGALVLDITFVLAGLAVMVQFVRAAQKVEPFIGTR